jgi:hypothetical protein
MSTEVGEVRRREIIDEYRKELKDERRRRAKNQPHADDPERACAIIVGSRYNVTVEDVLKWATKYEPRSR